jgi:hypothetical protein
MHMHVVHMDMGRAVVIDMGSVAVPWWIGAKKNARGCDSRELGAF